RPWRGLHRDLHAGLGRIVVDELLQIVRGIPFRPENGEFLVLRVDGRSVGKGQADTSKHAGHYLAHNVPPWCAFYRVMRAGNVSALVVPPVMALLRPRASSPCRKMDRGPHLRTALS